MQGVDLDQMLRVEQELQQAASQLMEWRSRLSDVLTHMSEWTEINHRKHLIVIDEQELEDLLVLKQMADVLRQTVYACQITEDVNLDYLEEMQAADRMSPIIFWKIPGWISQIVGKGGGEEK